MAKDKTGTDVVDTSAGANAPGSAAGVASEPGSTPNGNLATHDDLAELRAALAQDQDGIMGELADTNRRIRVLEDAGKPASERLDAVERDLSDMRSRSLDAAAAGGDFPARQFVTDLLNELAPYFRPEIARIREKYTGALSTNTRNADPSNGAGPQAGTVGS